MAYLTDDTDGWRPSGTLFSVLLLILAVGWFFWVTGVPENMCDYSQQTQVLGDKKQRDCIDQRGVYTAKFDPLRGARVECELPAKTIYY